MCHDGVNSGPQRADGSTYTSVLYVLNGTQTSTSFNDHGEALRFQELANRTSPAKALEVWATQALAVDGFTVASWCTHHIDHLTGVNDETRNKYRRYIANDIAQSKIGPLPLTALTNADVAQWLISLTGSAKTVANKHGFLAGALNAAVRARRISANPCDGNRLRRDEPAEMVFLTHDEFAILLSSVTEPWQPLVEQGSTTRQQTETTRQFIERAMGRTTDTPFRRVGCLTRMPYRAAGPVNRSLGTWLGSKLLPIQLCWSHCPQTTNARARRRQMNAGG
jgi:hypothetical protein